jgi:phosphoglycolate phosphatase
MRQIDFFDLIVFDWDGTLVDSPDKIVDCLLQAANRMGLESSRAEARSIIGLKLDLAVSQLFPSLDKRQVEEFILVYQACFRAHPASSKLFEGGIELLHWLNHSTRLHVAVATGKGRAGLDRELAEHNLSSFFSYTRCADEAVSKPHPQMLYDILAFTGVAPERTLMIGDTHFDLEMARNAGVKSLGLACGAHEPHMLKGMGSQAILARLDQVKGWLLSAAIESE